MLGLDVKKNIMGLILQQMHILIITISYVTCNQQEYRFGWCFADVSKGRAVCNE